MSLPSLSPSDISNAFSALTQSTLAAPDPTGPPPMPGLSIDSFIAGLQAANTDIVNGFTNAIAVGYSTLLPTADIANAVLTSMPSYDVNLFLNGILQVAHGDPMGLIHAVGYPIAADAALLTAAGGWELIVLVNAIALMLGGQLSG